jgi:hypothetical protein
VRFFRTEVMSQTFKLIDSGIALSDGYDTKLSRNYRVEWRLKMHLNVTQIQSEVKDDNLSFHKVAL